MSAAPFGFSAWARSVLIVRSKFECAGFTALGLRIWSWLSGPWEELVVAIFAGFETLSTSTVRYSDRYTTRDTGVHLCNTLQLDNIELAAWITDRKCR